MDRKKRREQTHIAYMQTVNTKTTTERVIGARGQCTTMESVIPVGRYRERARGWRERARKAQNYRRRGEERRAQLIKAEHNTVNNLELPSSPLALAHFCHVTQSHDCLSRSILSVATHCASCAMKDARLLSFNSSVLILSYSLHILFLGKDQQSW